MKNDVDLAVKSRYDALKQNCLVEDPAAAGNAFFRIAPFDPGKGARAGACSKPWTGRQNYRTRATLIYRWSRRHFFFITQAGPIVGSRVFPAGKRALGVAGQSFPWNFPLLDGGVETWGGPHLPSETPVS